MKRAKREKGSGSRDSSPTCFPGPCPRLCSRLIGESGCGTHSSSTSGFISGYYQCLDKKLHYRQSGKKTLDARERHCMDDLILDFKGCFFCPKGLPNSPEWMDVERGRGSSSDNAGRLLSVHFPSLLSHTCAIKRCSLNVVSLRRWGRTFFCIFFYGIWKEKPSPYRRKWGIKCRRASALSSETVICRVEMVIIPKSVHRNTPQ